MKRRLLLVLLSAILFSVGWYPLSGLPMLVGFIPLLIISRDYDASARSFWKMVGWVCLWMALWYAMTVWWVWNATPAGPPAALLFGLIYTAPPLLLYHYVSKRAPRSLAYTIFTAAWLVGEFIYNTSQASFPWLNIGNGFAHDIPLVQWYEYTGIFGGTLWVLLCNIVIFEAWQHRHQAKAWIGAGTIVLLPILWSLIIFWSYKAPDQGTIQVSVVQPNIDPYSTKFIQGTERMQEELILSLLEQVPDKTDFIVLPETVMPFSYNEEYLSTAPFIQELKDWLQNDHSRAMIVAGAETIITYTPAERTETARRDPYSGRYYDKFNSALGIDTTDYLPIHHKGRLVIGVESTPTWIFKVLKFLVIDLGGTVGQLGVGEPGPVFRHNGVAVGPAICYEGLYGGFYGKFVQQGAQAMLISSNDGWWGDTPGHKLLFSISRLRAIEHRRAIARSANTGTSGFINPRGDVLQKLGWERRGILTSEVELNNKMTFYTRYGDYLGRISEYVMGLCILYYIAYRVRKKNYLVE